MSRFIIKRFARFISILLVNTVLLSSAVFASEKSIIDHSTLSPKSVISRAEFSQGFENKFEQEISLLGELDKIDERKDYAKDFYFLSFQTLFPQGIQSLLVKGIKSHILSQVSSVEVKSINVELKETKDPLINEYYRLFEKTGNNNLSNLADNLQLIDIMLRFEGKRIDKVGFHPPYYKTESGRKKHQRYLRKWYSVGITGVYGQSIRKSFIAKAPIEVLKRSYDSYTLMHKFGDELRKSFSKGSAITFSVVITKNDGTSVQEEITLTRKDNQIIVKSTADKVEAEIDSYTRKQLHILSDSSNENNQINDFQTVSLISDSILKALEIASNKSGAKLTDTDSRKIEQLLGGVINWSERTRKQGGVTEKKQVSQLLAKIIAADGHLKNNDIKKTATALEKVLGLIDKRIRWLVERIQWRNNFILGKALSSEDRDLYVEVLKNRIVELQGWIRLGDMQQARGLILFIEQALPNENEFKASAKLSEIGDMLGQIEIQQTPEQALALIEEVDFYVLQQADNLRAILKWFTDRGFDKYSLDSEINYTDVLSGAIKELDAIQTPGRKYLDVINAVISQIDELGKAINLHAETSGKIKGVQKQILPRLRGVRKALGINRKKVALRNEKIKQMQARNYRYSDVNDARNQLQLAVEVNRASGSYSRLLGLIHKDLNTLYLDVRGVKQNIEPIGITLEKLLKDKGEQIQSANQFVLQAI